MGHRDAVVSAYSRDDARERRGVRVAEWDGEVAGVLPGFAGGGGEYRAGFAGGSDVWVWAQISGEVSAGVFHRGLGVWEDLRGASDAARGGICGDIRDLLLGEGVSGDGHRRASGRE